MTEPVNLELYSPEWWLKRLVKRLRDRAAACAEYDEFHVGRPAARVREREVPRGVRPAVRRLPANFMPLVVDAERERLIVQGFRFGNRPRATEATWRIWQENQLDAESQIAHEIALVKGVAYTLVAPRRAERPVITIEDPPRRSSRRRRATAGCGSRR
jgi:hypothetical protein